MNNTNQLPKLMCGIRSEDSVVLIPLDEIQEPRNGYTCVLNTYWIVTKGNHVLFYEGKYPQMTYSKETMEYLYKKNWSQYEATVQLVPVAYIRPER